MQPDQQTTPQPAGSAPGAQQARAAQAPRDAQGKLPAMEARGLCFAYGRNEVLKGIDLLIEDGKVTTVLGGNGCGKSTLFDLMTKNLRPKSGKVFLYGRNIAAIGLRDFARQVSIVHQHNSASADIAVEDLVRLGRTPYHRPMSVPSDEDERAVEWALQVTGTAALRGSVVSRLSSGQRQRVWIAMALAQNTKILFLDEPTTYLDVRYQVEILELVRLLNRDYGITVVMVLHDINQAIQYSDRIVGLADGAIVAQGCPEDVVTSDTIRKLYGIDLALRRIDGATYVMLSGTSEST